jgi:hypothetical protein
MTVLTVRVVAIVSGLIHPLVTFTIKLTIQLTAIVHP